MRKGKEKLDDYQTVTMSKLCSVFKQVYCVGDSLIRGDHVGIGPASANGIFSPSPSPSLLPNTHLSLPLCADESISRSIVTIPYDTMRFSTIITITASCCVASVRSASVEDGEFKNITIWNDNTTHIINDEATSFNHETIVVKDNTRLRIEANGYITAPINGYKSDTDWPAVQLSIGSVFIAKGGSITGPSATMEGTHGGEGIELYNGQSGPETASVAYFDDGVSVAGGDAVDGVGGNALRGELFFYLPKLK